MRCSWVGRILRNYRLDELPQVFNVLRGQMSLVGPRPERPEFVKGLSETIPYYSERHSVKPGVTGWAQLRYSYGATEEDFAQVVNDQAKIMAMTDIELSGLDDFASPYNPLQF